MICETGYTRWEAAGGAKSPDRFDLCGPVSGSAEWPLGSSARDQEPLEPESARVSYGGGSGLEGVRRARWAVMISWDRFISVAVFSSMTLLVSTRATARSQASVDATWGSSI
jgi:hypothetical protein